MPIRLHFNASALFANYSLSEANRLLETSLARLSSGSRIQRAGDDPAGLAIANGMRHHLRGLEQASANSESGAAMIQTAEGAMDQISTLLTKARSLAVSAANIGVNDQPQLDAYQTELDELLTSIDQIAERTSFAGRFLLRGDLAQTTLPADTRAVYEAVQLDHRALPGGIADGDDVGQARAARPRSPSARRKRWQRSAARTRRSPAPSGRSPPSSPPATTDRPARWSSTSARCSRAATAMPMRRSASAARRCASRASATPSTR